MVACAPIEREEVRAEVSLGDTLLAKTPYVLSFSINQSRGQLSTTCSVTLEMQAGTSFFPGAQLIIKAGTRLNVRTKFTGTIDSTTSQPAFGKAGFFTVTLNGRGVLSNLENKKFSRRLAASGQGMFCLITGGSSNRPSSFFTADKTIRSGNHTLVLSDPNPVRANGQNSPLIVHRDTGDNQSTGGMAARLAGRPSGGGSGDSSGSFRNHTHENTDEGGPAFAVYSVD